MITIMFDIPDELYESLRQHLEAHPDWDSDRFGTVALALLLLQNGRDEKAIAAAYLNALHGREVEP
jgi:hypothetical protein